MIAWKITPCPTRFFNDFTQHMPNQIFIVTFFSIYEVSSLSLLNLCVVQVMAFQVNLPSHCFRLIQYGYETFQNAKPALSNHMAKTSNLDLTLSLISTLWFIRRWIMVHLYKS